MLPAGNADQADRGRGGFVYFTQDINPAPGTKEGLLAGIFWGVFAAAHRRCHPVAVRTPQAARPFCAS
jgi:hypothetical protein